MAHCSVIRNDKDEIQQVLAPNGEESKLFNDIALVVKDKEEALKLWAQTQTSQFKEWFGNSKMVDGNGEPTLFYHVSSEEFGEFSRNKIESHNRPGGLISNLRSRLIPNSGFGFYFSNNLKYVTSGFYGNILYPSFLRIENPSYKEDLSNLYGDDRKGDGSIFTYTNQPIQDKLNGTQEVVVYNSNQIKSIFNRGEFSGASANIYDQRGETSAFSDFGKMQTILQKLYNRFNIPYRIIDNPNSDIKGQFVGDTVIINKAKVSGDTAFHEYLHPFILILQKENPQLYSALVDELSTTKDGIETMGFIQRRYSDLNQQDQVHEAIVTYLGRLAEAKYDRPMSAFNRFVNWLRSVFKKININFKDLPLTTKLSDIADLIVDDTFVADLRKSLINANLLASYDQRDTELTYKNLYERIKDKVAILNATIQKRKSGSAFKEDIENLNEIIKNSDEITSVNNFVVNAITYVGQAHKRFETLRDSVKKGDLSKGDLSYNLHILSELQQLLNVYQSLDDVKSLYVREGMKSTDDTMSKLADAINQKDLMVEDFKSFALSYLTDWLFPYLESTNKNLEREGKKDLVLSKDIFRDQLSVALRDISAAGYWLGATINSQDPVSAAVGLALKDIVYDNHVKDNEIKSNLVSEYDKVRGTALYKSAKDEEDFNLKFLREADSWEQIGEDEDGEPIYDYVKRLAFHTEYLTDQFEKDRREMYKRVGPKPSKADTLAYSRWSKAVTEWYNFNTILNPNYANLIAEKRKVLTKRQFERWLAANTKEIEDVQHPNGKWSSDYVGERLYDVNRKRQTYRVLVGDFILPSAIWRNTEFGTFSRNSYYMKLYNTYNEANERLEQYALQHGIIPQVSKGKNLFSDISFKKGVKEGLKQIKSNLGKSLKPSADNQYAIQRQDGTEVRRIPINFTRKLDASDLSLDLLSSTLKFSQMARNYESMAEIEPNILILRTVLNGDFNLGIKGREVAKTNAKGAQVINKITEKVVPKMSRTDMLDSRLNEFINDIVYGDSEFQNTINLFGKEISMNKLAKRLGLVTALQAMAINVNGGINNVVVGNFNNSIEAVGGRFWGKRDWLWAQGEYYKQLPSAIGELTGMAESPLNKLAEHYDVPQGEFQDEYGDHVRGGKINKLMKTSSLMFLQKGGEHQIQLTGMLSLMRAMKVKDKSGNEVDLYHAWEKSGHDFKKLQDQYIWTESDDMSFRNRLHAITKNLQGVYNSFDKAMLQRRWYGKLALMFRKYMFRSLKARYGSRYVDYELGTVEEGYWRAFKNKLLSDIKDYKWGAVQRMWSKEGYTDDQKAAINKTVYEFGVIIAMFVLSGLAAAPDDDKTWLDNETALQLTRFSADITQFINPSDFLRVVRNPAATVNTLENWIAWFNQLLTGPTDVYKRKSGFANAGDNKLYIRTLKLMPVVRQMINITTPDEQLKFYKLTGRN